MRLLLILTVITVTGCTHEQPSAGEASETISRLDMGELRWRKYFLSKDDESREAQLLCLERFVNQLAREPEANSRFILHQTFLIYGTRLDRAVRSGTDAAVEEYARRAYNALAALYPTDEEILGVKSVSGKVDLVLSRIRPLNEYAAEVAKEYEMNPRAKP